MITVYTYAKCSTCRKATDWLRSRKIAFEERPIRQTPPSEAELEAMLAAHQGEMKRLFNTSSQDYRDARLPEKLPGLSKEAAFGLLRKNGNLVKRPFLLGPGVALVGFDEERWAAALGLRARP